MSPLFGQSLNQTDSNEFWIALRTTVFVDSLNEFGGSLTYSHHGDGEFELLDPDGALGPGSFLLLAVAHDSLCWR
jgi:hypothetical protein